MAEKDVSQMTPVEIARRLAELGQGEKALRAYGLALTQEGAAPADRFEAACAVLQYGEDYKPAYDAFLELYREESLRTDALSILTDAFYTPNEQQIKKRYEKNCKLLKKYPYIFRTDFLPFEELPIKFYPYDDDGVIPFYVSEERFDEYINFNEPVIRRYFFRDLEKPILAKEIVSHYELEYLRDNVRRSDWVAKENHIYLHYADWGVFCSHLQHWDLKPLLEDAKFVFLIGDEIAQYPIDFKERFGIDYSRYSVKPFGIREINKIIWHTQLYAHNGGDFFNEMLHGHPCLLADSSVLFHSSIEQFKALQKCAGSISRNSGSERWDDDTLAQMDHAVLQQLVDLHHRSLKDCMVTYYLSQKIYTRHLDPASRIVPAIVYQPHFENISSHWDMHQSESIICTCNSYDEVKNSGLLEQFKYVKTFTPMRRPTNSNAATVRFMDKVRKNMENKSPKDVTVLGDILYDKIINRSFMVDKRDRLFADSRLVRFEDGKLNPTATFTALAEFMDVPYTESMTYCSNEQGKDPLYEGVPIGLDTAPVYRTYDEYADEYERQLMEYLMRDMYQFYGYDFHYYDGKPLTQDEIKALVEQCHTSFDLIRRSYEDAKKRAREALGRDSSELDEQMNAMMENLIARYKEARLLAVHFLRHGLNFCSKDGKPLRMMEPLKLDPALLQTELYH